MNRKLLGAAALTAAALAGGGLAGAVLGVPGVSGAQDSSTTTTTEDNNADDPGGTAEFHHGPFGPGLAFGGGGLEAAAEALGMSEDDLRTALEDGQSIAQVAESRNVDVQKVVDAMVADATARIDEQVAELKENLPERIADVVEREGLPDRGPHVGFRFKAGGLDAAAEALGISEDDLRTALEDGQSIADVAQSRNVDVQKVIDAMVAEATAHIDEAVADGHLDADDAADIKEDLPERIADVVEHEGFGFRHGPGPGPFGD